MEVKDEGIKFLDVPRNQTLQEMENNLSDEDKEWAGVENLAALNDGAQE